MLCMKQFIHTQSSLTSFGKTIKDLNARKFSFILILLFVCTLIYIPVSTQAQDPLLPYSVEIKGDITDNYANFTYELRFDNTASSEATEISWFFEVQEGIRLSNVSATLSDLVYWGRIKPVDIAEEIYNETVEANLTGVLVKAESKGYTIDMNVENGTEALLTIFLEGLLTRNMGLYSLILPFSTPTSLLQADFDLDVSISSNYGSIEGYSVTGLAGYLATVITDGIRLTYSSTNFVIPAGLTLNYVLERQTGGSQLLTHTNGTHNFFTYLLAPSIVEVSDIVPRQYVLVIDISGSMGGDKISQAKIAFSSIIDDLSETDLFTVVAFETEVSTLWDEPHIASETFKQEAKDWVSSLVAGGSTNFHDACITGLETFTEANAANVMLVLSDGEPTAGPITSTPELLIAISEANSKKVSISAVAFGYGADEGLMANMASQNNGFFTFIQTDEEATTKIIDFYKQFATPIASGYSIHIEGAYLTASLVPLKDSPFFNGSEVLLSGLYETSISIETIIHYAGDEIYSNYATDASIVYPYVESIWAQHRLSYLLNQVLLEGDTNVLRAQIISLALQYGLVVRGYTAIILTTLDDPEEPSEEATTTTLTMDSEQYWGTDNVLAGATERSPFNQLWAVLALIAITAIGVLRRKKKN